MHLDLQFGGFGGFGGLHVKLNVKPCGPDRFLPD